MFLVEAPLNLIQAFREEKVSLYTPNGAPEYNPKDFGFRSYCYSHALNIPEVGNAAPGSIASSKPKRKLDKEWFCKEGIQELVTNDGCISIPEAEIREVSLDSRNHVFYAVFDPKKSMHFVRVNKDGSCSHKEGILGVQKLMDCFRQTNFTNAYYPQSAGAYLVPAGGLEYVARFKSAPLLTVA